LDLKCTQCGGVLKYEKGRTFVSCSFCDASMFIDKSEIVFHYWIKPTLDMSAAHMKLRRWMAGNETVETLDTKSKTTKESFFFFPVWRFVIDRAGDEEIIIEPAVSTSVTEIRFMDMPAGMLNFYDVQKVENPDQFMNVDVQYESALQWLRDREIDTNLIKQASLVHVPVFHFTYQFEEYEYSAVVEAAAGKVMANYFPSKKELPFTALALGGAAIFFIEGLLCPTFLIRFLVMLATAVPMGFLANYVIRKY